MHLDSTSLLNLIAPDLVMDGFSNSGHEQRLHFELDVCSCLLRYDSIQKQSLPLPA